MFRYIFALLLLNSSYRSLGVPIPTSAPIQLGNLLTVLANSCENVFLSEQIKSKINDCTELKSPHGEKRLECFIFYDINKQLCAAVGASKLALTTEDYSSKINEEQDVNLLCGNTKDWVFSNLTELPRYKSSVERVFKHLLSCGKVCGVEDLMSDDANFYCKYFKWGTDMLKKQVIVPSTLESSVQLPPETGHIGNKALIAASNDLLDVQVKNATTSVGVNAPSVVASGKNEETTKIEINLEASSQNNQVLEPSSGNSAPSQKSETKTVVGEEPMHADENSIASNQGDKPAEMTNSDLKNKDLNIPDTALTKPGAEDSQKVDKEIQLLNKELERKEPVLETPGQSKDKQPSEIDDYQDSDEGKEGLGDIQGDDDSDDPMVDDVNKINKLDDHKEEQRESESIKTIVSGITGDSVSGLYPSFGQDGYSDDDDDDHFFSFFLTAVIMVVLIYVLYHNKNKVGKVFFGLILEGRQSGRRRNSRGHAYKRLDTLEQAMSTNTAAPPSKIIY